MICGNTRLCIYLLGRFCSFETSSLLGITRRARRSLPPLLPLPWSCHWCPRFKLFPMTLRFSNGSALCKMKMALPFERKNSRPGITSRCWKELSCFSTTTLTEGRKSDRTNIFALVDRGNFSLLGLNLVSMFRLVCSGHSLLVI